MFLLFICPTVVLIQRVCLHDGIIGVHHGNLCVMPIVYGDPATVNSAARSSGHSKSVSVGFSDTSVSVRIVRFPFDVLDVPDVGIGVRH